MTPDPNTSRREEIATREERSPSRRVVGLERPKGRSSILVGSLWMVVLGLALMFIPIVNGLVAGLVGGYKVGSVKRGLIAAVLPSLAIGILLWLVLLTLGLPVIGALAGIGIGLLVAGADLGLFLGAAIGGMISKEPQLPEARVR